MLGGRFKATLLEQLPSPTVSSSLKMTNLFQARVSTVPLPEILRPVQPTGAAVLENEDTLADKPQVC
jgi:hypothetical protein